MAASGDKAKGRVLLPEAVEPLRYDVKLSPDLEKFTFDGTVKITIDVREATDQISLHAKELMIKHDTVVVKPAEGEESKPVSSSYDLKENAVTFTFPEMLAVGSAVLEMEFIGILNDQMAGFYRSGYKDLSGKSKIMASTQFESLDARRAFPCWDEPARKAIFAVTLVIDAELTALSNMPEKSQRFVEDGKKTEFVFMDSPKMSTYLLAFVVGEFDFVSATTNHGVQVRVFTPPGRVNDAEFALKVATQSLDGYDDYFGIPYPLPKLDMIAIPEFAAGAMENWGLVTYREVDLLIAAGASRQQMQRVAIVVTHELAHQWFGNLVTMMWWDDLWLNEGFASWSENYMADVIFPDYSMWDQFTSDAQAAALRLDGLRSSHPIQVPIAHAEEVEEVFDAISYCKGACVIKMAHAYLGPKYFQKGLQEYFKKHKYSNTETNDLWAAWGAASGKPVNDLMASWTEQMGFPLLTVKSYTPGSMIELEQTWFLADGSEVKPEEEKLWKIPLILACGASVGEPVLMDSKTKSVSISQADFVMINSGRHVPMRVLYTDKMYAELASAVEKGLLPVADRAGLVLDAFALAKAGKLGADAVFRLLGSYKDETNYIVWDAISQALAGFDTVLMAGASDSIYSHYKAFVAKLIAKPMLEIGWEKRDTDGHLDGLLRETLVSMNAKFPSDPAVVAEAQRRFKLFQAGDNSALPDDIKVPVFKIILKSGGVEEYEAVRAVYEKATTNIEKKHVFESIGQTAVMEKKKEVLEWAISGDIKIQDFFYPIGSVSSSSKAAMTLAWNFFKSNFSKVQSMVKAASPSLMDAVISYSSRGMCSAAEAAEYEQFFKDHPLKQNARTISQVLEGIRANVAFLERILKTPVNDESFWKSL